MSDEKAEIANLLSANGKYQILKEIEEGANAHAFRAHHFPLKKDLFLKIYAVDPKSSDLFDEPRFLVEATAQEGRDSNLVRVYDAERLGHDYVLVAMEFIHGGSIHSRLTSGPMPMMDGVATTIGILHGVAQLHAALLVHRDIKPGNVLLSEKYGRVWPLITDFGSVAKLAAQNASVAASRNTALYVPPEGWEHPSAYDMRSDLYQVGLVLAEMVYGQLPYRDEEYIDREVKHELRAKGATRLSDLDAFDRAQTINGAIARLANDGRLMSKCPPRAYVPRNLSSIIKKATAPNPAARYQSASEMIGVLEQLYLPNWYVVSADIEQYRADSWQGWDWQIERGSSMGAPLYIIRRSQRGTGKYRRWKDAATAREACNLVSQAS